MATRLKMYKAYAFRGDKDPVIDKIHTMMEDAGTNYSKAAEMSGVSYTTIYNWIEGDTHRPQYATIAAVAGALGYEIDFRKIGTMADVISLHKRRKVA